MDSTIKGDKECHTCKSMAYYFISVNYIIMILKGISKTYNLEHVTCNLL